ncbi:MAG: dihydroorotase [Candidatus Sumerlaeia bacterium]
MKILIRGGRVIDPANGRDGVFDVLIQEGRIAAVRPGIHVNPDKVIEAAGLLVTPGLIDLHVHLRQPGFEAKETIKSGSRAAAAGGFTTICAMPNTNPCIDTVASLNHVRMIAAQDAVVNVLPVAAITRGRAGEQIVEFGDLVNNGAVAFSDDGNPVMNAEIVLRALEYTTMFDTPIMEHCEDVNLSAGGVMHKGRASLRAGLKGIPASSESVMAARDILLAEETGGHIHICHVSAASTVEALRRGKDRGVRVTAEVTPHHLTLTDEAVLDYDTNKKCHPPLRSEEDRQALIAALRDGTIDCIATDHAPHTETEKEEVFDDAPFGCIGLETAFAVCFTTLVEEQKALSLMRLVEAMTIAPARVIHLNKGTLSEGAPADVTLIDPDGQCEVTPALFYSKSKNSPFLGRRLRGWPVHTIVEGKTVFERSANLTRS